MTDVPDQANQEKATAGNSEPVLKNIPVALPSAMEGELELEEPHLQKLTAPHAPLETETPKIVEEKKPAAVVPPLEPQPTKAAVEQPQKPIKTFTNIEEFLNGGNAVEAAAKAEQQKVPPATAPKAVPETKKSAVFSATPFERSAREIGLTNGLSPESAKRAEQKIIEADADAVDISPRIRTYAADMGEAIRKRGSTLTSIVNAEKNRPLGDTETKTATGKRNTRFFLFLGGAAALLILGSLAVGVALLTGKQSQATPTRVSVISANTVQKVEVGTGENIASLLGKTKQSSALTLGEVEELVLTKGGAVLTAPEALALLGAPDILARNATNIMVGVHAFNHNQPFLLISVAVYDRTFEGMLAWEARISEGLGDFFAPVGKEPLGIANVAPALIFTDRVFQNIDLRESGPEWPIIYAFLRPDLILITTNESTLREVIVRLALQKSK